MILNSCNALSPINLYLTDPSIIYENNPHLQHHCLHLPSSLNGDNDRLYEILTFCLAEHSSTWIVQANDIDQFFTFDQLEKENITSEQT